MKASSINSHVEGLLTNTTLSSPISFLSFLYLLILLLMSFSSLRVVTSNSLRNCFGEAREASLHIPSAHRGNMRTHYQRVLQQVLQ
jgi:hypothetical protein